LCLKIIKNYILNKEIMTSITDYTYIKTHNNDSIFIELYKIINNELIYSYNIKYSLSTYSYIDGYYKINDNIWFIGLYEYGKYIFISMQNKKVIYFDTNDFIFTDRLLISPNSNYLIVNGCKYSIYETRLYHLNLNDTILFKIINTFKCIIDINTGRKISDLSKYELESYEYTDIINNEIINVPYNIEFIECSNYIFDENNEYIIHEVKYNKISCQYDIKFRSIYFIDKDIKRIIYLASTSKVKINAIIEAMNFMEMNYEIKAYDINSNINNQPYNEETLTGAINRYNGIIDINRNTDYNKNIYISTENGIFGNDKDGYYDMAYIIINNKVYETEKVEISKDIFEKVKESNFKKTAGSFINPLNHNDWFPNKSRVQILKESIIHALYYI
jgi:non-canonical (house-cleaning) NTP pyrophosphatase